MIELLRSTTSASDFDAASFDPMRSPAVREFALRNGGEGFSGASWLGSPGFGPDELFFTDTARDPAGNECGNCHSMSRRSTPSLATDAQQARIDKAAVTEEALLRWAESRIRRSGPLLEGLPSNFDTRSYHVPDEIAEEAGRFYEWADGQQWRGARAETLPLSLFSHEFTGSDAARAAFSNFLNEHLIDLLLLEYREWSLRYFAHRAQAMQLAPRGADWLAPQDVASATRDDAAPTWRLTSFADATAIKGRRYDENQTIHRLVLWSDDYTVIYERVIEASVAGFPVPSHVYRQSHDSFFQSAGGIHNLQAGVVRGTAHLPGLIQAYWSALAFALPVESAAVQVIKGVARPLATLARPATRYLGGAAKQVGAKIRSAVSRARPLRSGRGEGIPLTGNPRFDRLARNTPHYEPWKARLEAEGYTVVEKPLGAGNPANITKERIVEIDPAHFKYIDMLHESKHVGQIRWLAKHEANKSPFSPNLLKLGETGAYRYEMRLAERFGFSDAYKDYLLAALDAYGLPVSLRKKITRSARWRRIEKALAR